MGRRGPAPTPTALKLLHGETRPSRVNLTEPKPLANRPRMPGGMAPEARRVWQRVMREQAPDVILAADGDGLRIYCEAVARYEQAATLLAEVGPLIRGMRGREVVRNPLHQIVRENAELVRGMARELGLTPAARVGLHADGRAGRASMDDVITTRIGPPARLRVADGEL